MMKKGRMALTLSMLMSLTIIPALAEPLLIVPTSGEVFYPESESNGEIETLRQSYQTRTLSTNDLASSIDVYQAHYDALYRVPEIRAANPNIMFFVYYNSIHVWREGAAEYEPEKLELFIDNDWILRDVNGEYVTAYEGYAYYVDFGNLAYQAWLANWFNQYIDQYSLNGASIDNWFCESSVWYYVDGAVSPINPRTESSWSNQQICDAFKSLTLKVKQTIGSDKLVLVNGIYNGNHFYMSNRNEYYIDGLQNGGVDGIISEGWINSYDATTWYTEKTWKKSIDFAVWLEKNWLKGKYFMQISTDNSWWTRSSYPSDMTQAHYEQFVTYCYASRLLSVERLNSIICFGYYIYQEYPQKLFKTNLGLPTDDYHQLGSAHVYARTFKNGMVLVNPTSTAYTVIIGSGYIDAINGNSLPSSLTVKAHTGLIISKT